MARIILLYGPTASGKSLLAERLAEHLGGVVINADAMQLYSNLHHLTARPCRDEFSAVPHYFYGIREAREVSSAVDWAESCVGLLSDLGSRPAVICGGSGLYFQALVEGLSSMPSVSVEVREFYERRLAEEGLPALYEELCGIDEGWARRVGGGDVQRIIRGLSVYGETGISLSDWHGRSAPRPLLSRGSYSSVLLMPPRDLLWDWSRERLVGMVGCGALSELVGLLGSGLPYALPLMRAIGVREFGLYLAGELSLEGALDMAWYSTRRYIKRQSSWARHRFDYDLVLENGDFAGVMQNLFS